MKAVVAAFNQEKALVGAFSVITNLRLDLFEALLGTPDECSHCWQPCPSHLARCRGCGDENCSNSQTRLNYWKGESWILKWWLGSSCPHGTLSTGALSYVATDSVIHEMEPDIFGNERVLFDLLPSPISLLPPHNNQFSLLNPGVWSHHPIVAFYLTVEILTLVYFIFFTFFQTISSIHIVPSFSHF